jgi:F-type H+-transporting ATPase subunit b
MLENRNFLIPDATLIVEMIAFGIVLIVIAKFVLPRIRQAMQQRQDLITTALIAAAEADLRRKRADAQAQAVLASARHQASEITNEARSMRDHLIAEGRREGNGEYRWLAGRAEREAHRRAHHARLRGQQEGAAVAVDVLRDDIGVPFDRALVAALIGQRLRAQRASMDEVGTSA